MIIVLIAYEVQQFFCLEFFEIASTRIAKITSFSQKKRYTTSKLRHLASYIYYLKFICWMLIQFVPLNLTTEKKMFLSGRPNNSFLLFINLRWDRNLCINNYKMVNIRASHADNYAVGRRDNYAIGRASNLFYCIYIRRVSLGGKGIVWEITRYCLKDKKYYLGLSS